MKLLGWMHRKFRQNSETPKDFSIGLTGHPSLEDIQCYQRGHYFSKPFSKTQRDNYLRNSFASLEAARVEEDDLEEDPEAALTELFHGFLAIGTLGTDPITTDLGAEGRESCSVSSGRNSHVSAGRISLCSTVTLGGKPMENTETANGGVICPLQSYLFGSAIGLPDTVPPVRKEQRTSLGELFQKTKIADENSGTKPDRGEKRMEKETDKSAVYLMKRMLKKRMLHASSRSSNASAGGTMD